MIKQRFFTVLLGMTLLSQTAWAETAGYHLKRLEIQAKALMAVIGEQQPAPDLNSSESGSAPQQGSDTQQVIEEQLNQATEAPTWAENMALEDLSSVISTSQTLQERLKDANPDEYLKAKVELESLARRLRVSTAPLQLDPQEKATLEMTLLELEESIASVSVEREQQIAQKEQRRRSRTSVNVGFGWGGGWGGWGPWGYSPWGYSRIGWGRGFYRPFPRSYRRVCR